MCVQSMTRADWYAGLYEQPFFGAIGCAIAISFANFGASYGMGKSGIGIMSAGVLRPDNMVKSKSTLVEPTAVHIRDMSRKNKA